MPVDKAFEVTNKYEARVPESVTHISAVHTVGTRYADIHIGNNHFAVILADAEAILQVVQALVADWKE